MAEFNEEEKVNEGNELNTWNTGENTTEWTNNADDGFINLDNTETQATNKENVTTSETGVTTEETETSASSVNTEEVSSTTNTEPVFTKVDVNNLPAKTSFWSKIKRFFHKVSLLRLPEVQVELTPYQQKVEDEINDFLYRQVSFSGLKNLFKRKK